jgi:crotonobetainyl-CoA:carnitine CoA-transferase CaiB-like acyl-CoA transferase
VRDVVDNIYREAFVTHLSSPKSNGRGQIADLSPDGALDCNLRLRVVPARLLAYIYLLAVKEEKKVQNGALSHVRVVDLTDERGIYGSKLLADLGADVVRPEPPGGDVLRNRGPHHQQNGASLYYTFFGSNRRSFTVDVDNAEHQQQLHQLLMNADIVLVCDEHWAVSKDQVAAIGAERSDMLIVNVTSFGDFGPWRDFLAPDLVAGALGGAVATTGDVDTPPLKSFGELNFMLSGVYAAIGALSALYARETQGTAQSVDVSVHECIASCLEQVFMFYWYYEVMGRPDEQVLPRRGSTHWSNAFTVMNGQDGSIMITPTPDFDKQLAWLIEEDAFGDLMEPQYAEPENLPLLIGRVMELLAEWVAGKDVEALFHESQSRHIPYGWVQPLARVGENPQLKARQWFVTHDVDGVAVKATGAPYHLSSTPWHLADQSAAGADSEAILDDIGWGGKS